MGKGGEPCGAFHIAYKLTCVIEEICLVFVWLIFKSYIDFLFGLFSKVILTARLKEILKT